MTALLNMVLSGLVLIALSADATADGSTDTTGSWSIRAGDVQWTAGETPLVSGVFQVSATEVEQSQAAAPHQGGACLVADLVPYGIGRAHCAMNADCNGPDSIDREHDARLAEYVGYCAARDGSGETPRCWTRPGPAATYCRRTIESLRLTAGSHEVGPVNGDPLGNGAPYPEWAVYACMAHAGHDRACGEIVSPHRQVSLTPLP